MPALARIAWIVTGKNEDAQGAVDISAEDDVKI
jgi:hypothetical protein